VHKRTGPCVAEPLRAAQPKKALRRVSRSRLRRTCGGVFNLEAAKKGREYASGLCRASFHYYKPNQLLNLYDPAGRFL